MQLHKEKKEGCYTGSTTVPFAITTKDIKSADLDIRVPDVPYTGKAGKYQSKPVITDCDGSTLKAGTDYTIESYTANGSVLDKKSNPENGTTITVSIRGTGSYTGTATMQYKLRGISLGAAKIKLAGKSYTGNEVLLEENDILSAAIKSGKANELLVLGEDYEIAAYKNNIKKGTASVTFRGLGDYAGEKTVKFKIYSGNIAK